MRLNLAFLIILISALCGCRHSKEVNIAGKINGKIPGKITYTVPINGVSYFGFTESVVPDSVGNFRIKIVTKEPVFVILTISESISKTIVVEPGQNYNISACTDYKSDVFEITGANAAGQDLFNQFADPFLLLGEAIKFVRNPSQDSVIRAIPILKARDISKLQQLLDKKEISKSFFDLVSTDRDFYYAALTIEIQHVKFLISTTEDDLKKSYEFPVEMKKICEEVFQKFPLTQRSLMHSWVWFEHAQTAIFFKEYFPTGYVQQNPIDLNEKGLIYTHHIEQVKKYLSGAELEYYEAAYISSQCGYKEYQKALIGIFEQFKTDFPASEYTKYLQPLVDSIIAFQKRAENGFDIGVKFIDNGEKINSLKEAVKTLKGKIVYVDVWATWCKPCKEEFVNSDKLIKVLNSKGIEMLYISADKSDRDQLWKEMIKFYHLEGYHLRANEQLYEDLKAIQSPDGGFYVPWHILIDEEGNIVNDASKIAALETVTN